MKIPRTRRVCLVGKKVTGKRYRKVELKQIVSSYAVNFASREKVEKVRNCSQVDKVVVGDIVSRVLELCLGEENFLDEEVASSLAEHGVVLAKLKVECGGLQTLLRNHHFIFVVEAGLSG